jgi:uncharacterized protein YndB with AHSA1/START domain
MKNIVAKVAAIIDAPAAKIWKILTSQEAMKQYLYGTRVSTDWRIGSPILFTGEQNGQPYEEKGVILHSDPPKLFQYRSWNSLSGTEDKPENYIPVSYELYEENDKTTLTITHENIPSESARERAEENWAGIISNLKYMAEVGRAIPTA